MVKMKLDLLLEKHRISQRELSLLSGIRYETINRYTNNSHKYISNAHLNTLCKFFRCKISDIIEYIEDSN